MDPQGFVVTRPVQIEIIPESAIIIGRTIDNILHNKHIDPFFKTLLLK